jgi:hypothetical protein
MCPRTGTRVAGGKRSWPLLQHLKSFGMQEPPLERTIRCRHQAQTGHAHWQSAGFASGVPDMHAERHPKQMIRLVDARLQDCHVDRSPACCPSYIMWIQPGLQRAFVPNLQVKWAPKTCDDDHYHRVHIATHLRVAGWSKNA